MKKFSLILALLAALVMIFAACPSDGNSNVCKECGKNPCICSGYEILFDLEEFLESKTLGKITNSSFFTGKALLVAGSSPSITVVEVSGKKALLIEPAESWNGIDLIHNIVPGHASRTVFDFKHGDIIELAGNDKPGSNRATVILSIGKEEYGLSDYNQFGDWNSLQAGNDFSHEFQLQQADINKIIYTGGGENSKYTGFRIRSNETQSYRLSTIRIIRPNKVD